MFLLPSVKAVKMHVFLLAPLLVLSGLAVLAHCDEKRVLNGRNATIEEFPYLVELILNAGKTVHCCGSIISENLVLTAAHCFNAGNYKKEKYTLRSGTTFNNGTGAKKHKITDFFIHEFYNYTGNSTNDIAIFKVDPPFQFDATRKPISISPVMPKTGDEGVIAGWGFLDILITVPSTVLQTANVPIFDNDACRHKTKWSPRQIYPDIICAGGKAVSRRGDSGSALTLDGKIVGVTSFSLRENYEEGYPAGFTSVAYHIDWIKEKVEKLNETDVEYS